LKPADKEVGKKGAGRLIQTGRISELRRMQTVGRGGRGFREESFAATQRPMPKNAEAVAEKEKEKGKRESLN